MIELSEERRSDTSRSREKIPIHQVIREFENSREDQLVETLLKVFEKLPE